jgi:hypothetical protein
MPKTDGPQQHHDSGHSNWRSERRSGSAMIALSVVIALGLWLSIRYLTPPIANAATLADKIVFAFKWWCLAVLFCFATGIDAVAHERLQSPAFDPLAGFETKRMKVNLRYLQNTLEQLIMFSAGLFGLALYSHDGNDLRAVEATAVVWIVSRFAFWIGYHRSAAMRGLGAAGIGLALIVLVYVAARIGFDLGGTIGRAAILALFITIEAVLFWTTRYREESPVGTTSRS